MRIRRGRSVSLAVVTAALVSSTAAGAQSDRAALLESLDSAAHAHVQGEIIAGVSVAVVQRGETLLQRGYGYVDLEWGVETPRDGGASYEIGSVTKQFTAAGAMLLVEEGKLNLEADFTDYVDFDSQGHTVPVRRLLDHTSGIKGYTEMTAFDELSSLKLPRDSLMRIVERAPFEFEPGAAQIYNNSAYFLLGLIIEAVSGQPYEDFVAERLFEPAGMNDSYYCSEALVRERRAHGYDAVRPDMLIRARYLDHTWPYAAGSLCSTVGDLVRWNLALHGGTLLREGSYRAMTTPTPLEDGTPIRYAMGLQVHDTSGRLVIQHGGGINGFLSDGRYYPDEELLVVVLQNSTGPVGPGSLAADMVELVLGPAPKPASATFEGNVGELTGSYRGPARGETMTVSVTLENGALALRTGEPEETGLLDYRGGLRWALGDVQVSFVRSGGRIAELRFDTGGGHYVLRRVDG